MFAAPLPSRGDKLPTGEAAYQIAYLQAMSPLESDKSRYQMMVMDRDGSNRRLVFPPQGEVGIEPLKIVWSPGNDRIALTYRGDLWIVDVLTGVGQRVTGDGQTSAVDWKP